MLQEKKGGFLEIFLNELRLEIYIYLFLDLSYSTCYKRRRVVFLKPFSMNWDWKYIYIFIFRSALFHLLQEKKDGFLETFLSELRLKKYVYF